MLFLSMHICIYKSKQAFTQYSWRLLTSRVKFKIRRKLLWKKLVDILYTVEQKFGNPGIYFKGVNLKFYTVNWFNKMFFFFYNLLIGHVEFSGPASMWGQGSWWVHSFLNTNPQIAKMSINHAQLYFGAGFDFLELAIFRWSPN